MQQPFYDPNETPIPARRYRRASQPAPIWNILTIAALIATVLVAAWTLIILITPNSTLNPFPFPSIPQLLVLPTATPTSYQFPPTWTPEVSLTPSATLAPSATQTQNLPPTNTPVGSKNPTTTPVASNYPFALQSQPSYVASTLFLQDSGCEWQGAAGQVFDMKNGPVLGVQVRLGGKYAIKNLSLTTLTGLARNYGESGYEFQISSQPIDTKGTLWIQLFDQADIPISPRVYFDTFNDCQRNLALINFKQVR
ncbi:MAG: hypothetical protein HGA53_06625 [Anaerolineaceae bacterium]|nr:hypothetical protein [Anaerolineaceae bacterium]